MTEGILESFIGNYPNWTYLILFAGAFIDAEVFFVTAIIFALQGFLSWPMIIISIFSGVVFFDAVWYQIGRYTKGTRLGTWLSKKIANYQGWLNQNFLPRYAKMAFYSKFIHYVNRITPFLAGRHGLSFRKFIRIHFYAAIFWLSVMLVIGYFLSFIVELVGAQWVLRRMEFVFLSLIILFVGTEYLLKRKFIKRIKKGLADSYDAIIKSNDKKL